MPTLDPTPDARIGMASIRSDLAWSLGALLALSVCAAGCETDPERRERGETTEERQMDRIDREVVAP